MTATQEGGECSAARPSRNLPPGKTRYPFYRRLGGPQRPFGRVEKSRPHRDSIPDRPAPSHWATRSTIMTYINPKLKVNQSRYRPGVTQRVPGSWGSQISWQRHRMVVRLLALGTDRLYPQGIILVFISVTDWVNPGAIVGSEGFYVNEKFEWHHLESDL